MSISVSSVMSSLMPYPGAGLHSSPLSSSPSQSIPVTNAARSDQSPSESSGNAPRNLPSQGSAQVSRGAEANRSDSVAQKPDADDRSQQQVEQVVAQLKARDREVRTHEMAHVAAGGQYVTSGPSYSYQTGPDGQRYAVGGSVGIDTSPVRDDPEATIQKARQVIAAAMAPSEPSSTDRQVASQASQMAMQASAELASERSESRSEDTSDSDDADNQVSDRSVETSQMNVIDEREQPDRLSQKVEQGTERMEGTMASEARNAFELRMMDQRLALIG